MAAAAAAAAAGGLTGMWAPAALRLLRVAVSKTTRLATSKLALASQPLRTLAKTSSHTFSTHAARHHQPVHPAAILRQLRAARGAGYHKSSPLRTLLARFSSFSTANGTRTTSRFYRALPRVRDVAASRVARSTRSAPFASTLRPSLTGGALPRSAGGYGLGAGGARYFSHTPAAPAQVVNNVSQAVRAFMLRGNRARFDGVGGALGEKRYRAVSAAEEEASRKVSSVPRFAPGAYIDFKISPTLTALSPLAAAFPHVASSPAAAAAQDTTLNSENFLDFLSGDFNRAIQDLTTIFADLKRLAFLGDLPISIESPTVLRVRFPGVDAGTVERLCDDAGVRRGFVGEDPGFGTDDAVDMALRFPFAPDAPGRLSSPGGTLRSLEGHEVESEGLVDEAYFEEMEANPWISDPEEYESRRSTGKDNAEEYEGLEGIYRFIAECDRARRKY